MAIQAAAFTKAVPVFANVLGAAANVSDLHSKFSGDATPSLASGEGTAPVDETAKQPAS